MVATSSSSGVVKLRPVVKSAYCGSSRRRTRLTRERASISVTPETELQMGMGFPVTGRALAHGLRPGFGSTSSPSEAATC